MILDIYGLSIFMIITVALKKKKIDACFHKWKGMLTWNRSLKMKHLKKGKKYIINEIMNLLMLRILWTIKMIFGDLNLNEFYPKSWSWFRDIYKLRFIMNQDFFINRSPKIFPWLFKRRFFKTKCVFYYYLFMIWFLYNSLYSWNVYRITQLLSSWYSLCGD